MTTIFQYTLSVGWLGISIPCGYICAKSALSSETKPAIVWGLKTIVALTMGILWGLIGKGVL